MSFKEYLREGTSFEGVDLTRDRSPSRDIDLCFLEFLRRFIIKPIDI